MLNCLGIGDNCCLWMLIIILILCLCKNGCLNGIIDKICGCGCLLPVLLLLLCCCKGGKGGPDFGFGGWTKDNPLTMGYAPKIAENKYQCSMYLSAAHEWGSFEFEVYSDLNDSKELGFSGKSLSGKSGKRSNRHDHHAGAGSEPKALRR